MTEKIQISADYEIMYIMAPNSSTKEAESELQTVRDLINSQKGEIVKELALGKRELAYPIAHNETGVYHMMWINTDPSTVPEINKLIELESPALRHLIVKVEDDYTFDTAIMDIEIVDDIIDFGQPNQQTITRSNKGIEVKYSYRKDAPEKRGPKKDFKKDFKRDSKPAPKTAKPEKSLDNKLEELLKE